MTLASSTIWGSKLDGNSNDVLGSYNGTDTSITYNSGNGIITQGAGFGGSSKIAISATPVLGSTNTARSFSYWIKTSTSGSFGWVATGQVASNFHSLFDLYHNSSGQPCFQINPTNSGSDQLVCHSGTAINNGSFHHVVVTYSGSKAVSGVKIYVDNSNTSLTTDADNMTTTTVTIDEFHIGDRGGAGAAFNGAIDEFYVFNYELSSGDVSTLYNGGAGLQYPFSTTNMKSYNTNLRANIKSINTNLIANVKSLNTNV